MTTLREHLEAIRARHSDAEGFKGICDYCGGPMPCKDVADAVAALVILDNAERTVIECGITGVCEYDALGSHVLVDDPEPLRVMVRSDPEGFLAP